MLNKKSVLLGVLILIFTGSIAAFDLNLEDDLEKQSLQGGETQVLEGIFTHQGNFDDVQLSLEVYSPTGMDGAEFYHFTGDVNGEGLDCNESGPVRKNASTVVYRCDAEDLDENEVDFELEFDTAVNIEPGDYSFRVEVGPSLIPEEAETSEKKTEKVPSNGRAKVKSGNANVEIDTEPDSTVTARSFNPDDEQSIPKPSEESEGVGAVTVTTSENNNGGNVTFEHDKDIDQVEIDAYYWDTNDAEWTDDNIENVEVNETHVTVEVEHYSTYAAYSEPEEEEEETDNGGSGGGGSISINQFEQEPMSVEIGDDRTVEVGEDLLFNASVSDVGESEVSFKWDLGNGETAEENPVSYSYSSPGDYEVSVNVSTEESYDRDSLTVSVEQSEQEQDLQDTDQEGQTGEEEGQEADEESGQLQGETPGSPQANSLTGQFTESPGSIVILLVLIAAVLTAYLYRRGSLNFDLSDLKRIGR